MRNINSQNFGQALGGLVRQKRKAQGLTQMQLSEDAFGTTAKTRRISELETGSVANPHPKTIDPIIVTLGITNEEIEDCARQSATRPDEDLDRAYREARNLIEAIAHQFENDRPSASLAELDRFLRAKASEWSALRKRIETIDSDEKALSEIKQKAASALADGRLNDVDRLLEEAEKKYQYNRTLHEVRKLAQIRISRADTCLLEGDADKALSYYCAAAEFYRPFDEKEMAQTINEIAHYVYEISRHSLKPVFYVAASLLELLVTLPSIKSNSLALTEAYYQLGLSYRNEYDNTSSERRGEALSKAIQYSTLAVESPSAQAESYKALTTTIGLANCLRDRAKENSSFSDIQEGIRLLLAAQENYGDDGDNGPLLAILYNSLGAIYSNVASLGGANEIPEYKNRALDAFHKAVDESELSSDPDTWGASKYNIGLILMDRAAGENVEPKEQGFLRLRAIVEITAAIETFPAAAFPFRFADAQSSLGRVLFQQGVSYQDETLSETYLIRAINALELATEVFDEDRHPKQWATARATQGNVFAYHADWSDITVAIDDLQRAIKCYEEAETTFSKHGYISEATICVDAIAGAHERRNTLVEEN